MVTVREDLTVAFATKTGEGKPEIFLRYGRLYSRFNGGTVTKQVADIWAFCKASSEGTQHFRRVGLDNERLEDVEFYRVFAQKTEDPRQTVFTKGEDGKHKGYVHEYPSAIHMTKTHRERINSGEITLDEKYATELEERERRFGLRL